MKAILRRRQVSAAESLNGRGGRIFSSPPAIFLYVLSLFWHKIGEWLGRRSQKMAKNRHFYGFFTRFQAIFGVLQRTLTPSFVGSNPATPASYTIYCIRKVLPNTIYGFCFIWLFYFFPKLGKDLGKLFGRNFIFCPDFSLVLPAGAGVFALFLLLQKWAWGKFRQ